MLIQVHGYSIGFVPRSQFLWKDGGYGKNVVIFGVNNSSSDILMVEMKNILILGEGPIQGWEDTTITAKGKYP